MVYKWLNYNLSRWFPQNCILCGQTCHSSAICSPCREDLPRPPAFCCRQCGLPLVTESESLVCGQCLQQPPAFDRVVSALAYASPVAELVTGLKFQQRIAHARILGELLAARLKQVGHNCQAILPVPLHPRRVRERGFNQALEIARPLSKLLSLPLRNDVITRRRHTAAQSSQLPEQRKRNVRGAFGLLRPPDVHGIAILDDVMTSGQTANEIARLLRSAGVSHVEVWCVARTLPH